MPELAEVEYYCNQWRPALDHKVATVYLNSAKRVFRGTDTDALVQDLEGARFVHAATHGKQMCFRFGESSWLGVHLGMTGKTTRTRERATSDPHSHLVLEMEGGDSLVFTDARMFGRILYTNTNTTPDWWADLPPEILTPEFTFEWMNRFLDKRKRSQIKSVLLMQEAFPGIGNWMADEILWRARIRPHKRVEATDLDQREHLYERVREVCADARRVIAPDWGTPPDAWLFNHRWKDGGMCPMTGKPLVREQIGGRTSCWSPSWQS